MPIVFIGERVVLVCANQAHPAHAATGKESTMEHPPGWHALMSVTTPTPGGAPPNVSVGSLVPIKVYACSVCGYIELYAGAITDPNTWRAG